MVGDLPQNRNCLNFKGLSKAEIVSLRDVSISLYGKDYYTLCGARTVHPSPLTANTNKASANLASGLACDNHMKSI